MRLSYQKWSQNIFFMIQSRWLNRRFGGMYSWNLWVPKTKNLGLWTIITEGWRILRSSWGGIIEFHIWEGSIQSILLKPGVDPGATTCCKLHSSYSNSSTFQHQNIEIPIGLNHHQLIEIPIGKCPNFTMVKRCMVRAHFPTTKFCTNQLGQGTSWWCVSQCASARRPGPRLPWPGNLVDGDHPTFSIQDVHPTLCQYEYVEGSFSSSL